MAPVILQDELINDASNDNPVAGLKGSLNIKERFKYRLSRLLGRIVTVSDAPDSQSINIYVAPRRGAPSSTKAEDDRARKFITELQDALRRIAWCSAEDLQKEEVSQDLWDLILVHVSPGIHDTITKLRDTFDNNAKKFDAVVTQICGLDDVDEFGSSLDFDLGDLVITLQQLATSYTGTVKQHNELVEFACDLLQHPGVDVRLRCLLGSVFSNSLYDHGAPVPPGSDTYYLFGFTTCRNKKEEGDLADYYRQLLKTNIERTIVFTSINKALEHSTLAGLLRNKAGPNLDKYFPALQQFLAAQPEKRFSAHRLVQFIRDEDNDEPLPCLKRDYGFGLCTQREHVTKLKALYGKVIDKAGPGKLHYACTFGRLPEHAVSTLGFVDPSMRRLLHSDYPNPAVGYDNMQGLEKYMMPLFKRTLRG
ncbi:hypothetical protein N0V87_002612 [Didymella glomerata]|uniref:Uncharacterized protein n=1 Tax=Didymella glomerata TaxID=749621 RepID=A0A9W9C3H8_9PLEO|nr:hypothetical protein N0V87_002612 [Didymella glomerata]